MTDPARQAEQDARAVWLPVEREIVLHLHDRLQAWRADGCPPPATYFTSGLERFVASELAYALDAADAELARLRAAMEVVAKGGCKRFPIWSCLEERRGVKEGGYTRACDPPAVVLRPDYLCDACRAKAALEGKTDE
jgi:hypothetical protein